MYNVFDDFMLFVCRFRDLSEPGEGKNNFGSLKRKEKLMPLLSLLHLVHD